MASGTRSLECSEPADGVRYGGLDDRVLTVVNDVLSQSSLVVRMEAFDGERPITANSFFNVK